MIETRRPPTTANPASGAGASPYRGLEPYLEADWQLFFGRERECALIAANLAASRLTLLYGPSGIGKTSVLRAGVAHQLAEEAASNRNAYGSPEHAVVVFSSWSNDPVPAILTTIADAVEKTAGRNMDDIPAGTSFTDALAVWATRLPGELLIILDQFEEYFLYHGHESGPDTFAYEFPRAVNRLDIPVHFLVSIREDALARLDRFKGALPDLFGNYLRLDFLDREAGRAAIEKPLQQFNKSISDGTPPVGIEPALTEAVLDQVEKDADEGGEIGGGVLRGLSQRQSIDTSLLQVVMRRLWQEETRAGWSVLRMDTFKRLGSARDILASHLDEVLGALPDSDQNVAAGIFRYLVTPSGMKIAYSAADLATYTPLSRDAIQRVLVALSSPTTRILRPVAAIGHPEIQRYEIYHDRLADAILGWRTRYLAAQAARTVRSAVRRTARRLLWAALALIGILAAYVFLRPPEIRQFYATSPAMLAGGSVDLVWDADRAVSVTIDPPGTNIDTAQNRATVSPDQTTQYTLTARNWFGLSSSATTRVAVVQILRFDANPGRLASEGQGVTLTWDTIGTAGQVSIEQDRGQGQSGAFEPVDEIKDPKSSGTAVVHPTASTTYRLTAIGQGGVTAQQTASIAIDLPTISRFEVTSPDPGNLVYPGDPVQLSWVATGLTGATITTDRGEVAPGQQSLNVTGRTSVIVRPTQPDAVQYTLTATNASGSKPATLTVKVEAVAISQFTASPTLPSTLQWSVQGANDLTQVSIEPDIGRVAATGKLTVQPVAPTQYVLTVVSADSTQIRQRVSVGTSALPLINVFAAPTPSIRLGDQIRLTWSVQNADSIEIRTDQQDLILRTAQLNGSVIDIPPESTTYILRASAPTGTATQSFSVTVNPPAAP